MAIETEILGIYKGYEIVKYTSSVGDVIYEACEKHEKPFYYITCSSDNLEDLYKKVDRNCEISYEYKKMKYKNNSKKRIKVR